MHSIYLLRILFCQLQLDIRCNNIIITTSLSTRTRHKGGSCINRPHDVVVHEAPDAVLLDGFGCAARRRCRRSIHHKTGVRWRRPRRCLRVELLDVAPGGEGDGVAGMREIAEERESRRVRATGRSECRGRKRVASSLDSIGITLDLPSVSFPDA